tara:strand:+ start:502 stop:720 length:219 start_codon:yes stop_codon:yes gene_type:complete
MKKIISLDLTNNSFRELQVMAVVNWGEIEVIEVWYDDCTTPMHLDINQYTDLTMGRITELHPGEINLLLVRE